MIPCATSLAEKGTKFCDFVFVFIFLNPEERALAQINKMYIFQSKIVNLQLPNTEPYKQYKT